MMRRSAALSVSLLLLVFARSAHADPKACIAASDKGQSLRNDGKLTGARAAFAECAAEACPAAIRKDCTGWLGEVDAALPTIVLGAKIGAKDVIAVRVSMDGVKLVDALDGRAIPIDPGSHVFHFETDGEPSVDKTVLVKQGEKNRGIDATWGVLPATATGSAPPLFQEGEAMVTLDVPGGDPILEKKRSSTWSTVCTGGCNRSVPLEGLYRLNGSGVSTTAPFSIDARPGEHVVLGVEPGSNHSKTPGLVLIGTGAGLAGLGLGLLIIGAATPEENSGGGHTPSPLVAVGPIVGGVGVVLLVTGIILLATGKADVSQTKAAALLRAAATGFAF